MATTTHNDMKNYDQLAVGTYYERIANNLDVFNAASGGSLAMLTSFIQGDFAKKSFFKNISALSRRDDTSTGDAAAAKLTQDEDVSVKTKHKFLMEATRDSFRSLGISQREFALNGGVQMADETKEAAVNKAIMALSAFLGTIPEVNLDVSGDADGNTISFSNLNNALKLFGDRSSRINTLVMSGAAYHDLMGTMIGASAEFNDSGISVYNGSAPTLGRRVVVTDNMSLETEDEYVILGLQSGAVSVTMSEANDVVFDTITGKENLIERMQGEGAFNIQLMGAKWDAEAGRNPTDAALATGSNWIQNVTSHKNLGGVRLVVAR